jgi:hypothetical protein
MTSVGRVAADPLVKWAEFRLTFALWRLRLAMKAYDPDQPRAPGGTAEGGQWIAAGEPLDLIQLAGGFTDDQLKMTVRDFVSKMCLGSVSKEIPGQFWGLTVNDLIKKEKAGVPLAHRCYKLLNEDRFRK